MTRQGLTYIPERDGARLDSLGRRIAHPVAEVRFWSRVVKSDGCWSWAGTHSKGGYAQFSPIGNRHVYAHRYIYELVVGPIPEGFHIDHLCRNRGCINPSHLEAVTPRENWRRGLNEALKTHCVHGHPYEGNRYFRKSGKSFCRICHLASCKARKQRMRAA